MQLSNAVLREQAAAREDALRRAQDEVKRLRAQLVRDGEHADAARKSASELARKEQALAELHARLAAVEAARKADEAALSDLTARLAEQHFGVAHGKNIFERTTKENHSLKRQVAELTAQVNARGPARRPGVKGERR